MKTSTYIKKIRLKLCLTQAEFGKKVWPGDDVFLVRNRIAKYETGRAMPPGDVILNVQKIFKKYSVDQKYDAH